MKVHSPPPKRKDRERRRVRRALAFEFLVVLDMLEKLERETLRAQQFGAVGAGEAEDAQKALDVAWHQVSWARLKAA